MKQTFSLNGPRLHRIYDALRQLPGGMWLFSKTLAWIVPYSGTIGAHVVELRPGYAQMRLYDRRRVRNHLQSIHAVALVNLGEVTSGLALNTRLASHIRGIVTQITTEYFKKARGNLTASCQCDVPEVHEDMDYLVYTEIFNTDNELVATTQVRWRLGPKPEASHESR